MTYRFGTYDMNVGDQDLTVKWQRAMKAFSERPSERLIPWLWRSHPDDLRLPISHVKVEMGEEFGLRQRVSRMDAEPGMSPWRRHAGIAADFNTASHP